MIMDSVVDSSSPLAHSPSPAQTNTERFTTTPVLVRSLGSASRGGISQCWDNGYGWPDSRDARTPPGPGHWPSCYTRVRAPRFPKLRPIPLMPQAITDRLLP